MIEQAWIDCVRSFNRTVTERVGALNDHFLGRRRPVGEARLLWEIGDAGAETNELAARLSLAPADLDRQLHSLERQRLIVVEANGTRARLTEAGSAERRELDVRSVDVAQRLLAPLSDKQRSRIVEAMSEIERLLTASLVTVAVEDPATPDARSCVGQYFAELACRFETGFDAARSLSADDAELTPPNGLLLIARLRDTPIGCGALKFHGAAPAELKRMWVSPRARGLGVGSRLLRELEEHARAANVSVLRLETNRALTEAIALYRSSGYVEVAPFNAEPYAHHWFEKRI